MRKTAAAVLGWCVLATVGPCWAMTWDQIDFWVGTGPHRAAMVVDWADNKPALAWGYRFSDGATSEDMLRAIVDRDHHLNVRIGQAGGFGVPLYGVGYDRDGNDFEINDGTQFPDGIAVTGPSDGALAIESVDRYAEGWFYGHWALFVAADNPYSKSSWQTSASGISGRTLSDGSWDGMRFTEGGTEGPGVPIPAVRRPWTSALPMDAFSIPEPSSFCLGMWVAGAVLLFLNRRGPTTWCLAFMFFAAHVGQSVWADGFATTVVDYVPGDAVLAGFDDPAAALGSPTRITDPTGSYGGPVTPFNPPFGVDELVTVGPGGALTLGFDQPVFDRDDSFGIDLILFGNTFFFDVDFPNGVVGGAGEEPGTIEVSPDGTNWMPVAAMADTIFPTLAYQDLSVPYPTAPGAVPSDFHKPVDPDLDPAGMTMMELVQAYAGSGGGTGIDISSTGFDSIQFIRITNPAGSLVSPEVDAVSVVPEPTFSVLVLPAIVAFWRSSCVDCS